MGEDAFLESLGEAAAEERRRIMEDAGREAAGIAETARREARALHEEGLRLARARAASERARIVNAARLEAQKIRLEAAHRIADRLLARLRRHLGVYAGTVDYRRALGALLEECDLSGEVAVTCRELDRPLLEELIGRRSPAVRFHTGEEILGGLIVSDPAGRRVQRNTFESRLRKLRHRILCEIGRFLDATGGEDRS